MTYSIFKEFITLSVLVFLFLSLYGFLLPSRADEIMVSEPKTDQIEVNETTVTEPKTDETKANETTLPQPLTQNLVLDPNKRLEAAICGDSMNRIAVINDRIIQVFGDSGAFESQNDGDTGQLFLKPTDENGSKDLSLTLITEQGITQDLTLKPTAQSATTLIFKSKNFGTAQKSNLEMGSGMEPGIGSEIKPASFSSEPNTTYQDQLLSLVKQAVKGQLPLQDTGFFCDTPSRSNPEGYTVSHHQSYVVDPYVVSIFYVENVTNTAIEVQEKTFYQTGDLALSLQKRILLPEGKTFLYAVRLVDQNGETQTHD